MSPHNAAERKDVRRAEKVAKLADRQRGDMIRGIMSAQPGRAWVLDRLENANVFATTFNTDALLMAFAEGNRNQGLILLNDIMIHCPEQYILMMRERNERDAIGQRAGSPDPDGGDSESDEPSSESGPAEAA